jgi:hypothetical protein
MGRNNRPILYYIDEKTDIWNNLWDWDNVLNPVRRRTRTFYCILMKDQPLELSFRR